MKPSTNASGLPSKPAFIPVSGVKDLGRKYTKSGTKGTHVHYQ